MNYSKRIDDDELRRRKDPPDRLPQELSDRLHPAPTRVSETDA
jgi:hypothetical protein